MSIILSFYCLTLCLSQSEGDSVYLETEGKRAWQSINSCENNICLSYTLSPLCFMIHAFIDVSKLISYSVLQEHVTDFTRWQKSWEGV